MNSGQKVWYLKERSKIMVMVSLLISKRREIFIFSYINQSTRNEKNLLSFISYNMKPHLLAMLCIAVSCNTGKTKPVQQVDLDKKIVIVTNPKVCFYKEHRDIEFNIIGSGQHVAYDWDENIPAIKEITDKCECKTCPPLKDQKYEGVIQ